MNITSFAGINNVADTTRLQPGELQRAENVDIDERGLLTRRRGYAQRAVGAAHSPFLAPFGLMAVLDNDLVLLNAAGDVVRTIYDTLGYTRVWYALLPDGRVVFSNGLIAGVASATETAALGVPSSVDPGVGVVGSMPYALTYVRSADGLEGAPTYGLASIDPAQAIIGLPAAAGYRINIYFAPHGEFLLAGSTLTDTFTHGGGQLGVPLAMKGLGAPPVGRLLTMWNSRLLIADGSTLWASLAFRPELCNLTRDFLQFDHDITLLFGTDTGLFVGTTTQVMYLTGTAFDQLQVRDVSPGGATLGSCVVVDAQYLNEKVRPRGAHNAAVCLVDGVPHVLAGEGTIVPLAAERYRFSASEVWATARLKDGVLQYIAAPA